MPYPLPPGDSYEESLRWFLVAVPDRVEYVTAALGAYTELSKRHLWGLEGIEAGSEDAAQSWALAIAATLEALEMGFPENLLSYIDEVEALLRQIRDSRCCDPLDFTGGGGEGEGTIQPTGDDDGVPTSDNTSAGPFPPDFETDPTGETPFDAETFRDYRCGAYNMLFDWLVDVLRYALWSQRIGRIFWDVLREILLTITNYLIPGVWDDFVWLTLSQTEEAINDYWDNLQEAALESTITLLETDREEIICEMINAPNAAAAITAFETYLGNEGVAALIIGFIKSLGLGAFVALIFNGIVNREDYAEAECDCVETMTGYAVKHATVGALGEWDGAAIITDWLCPASLQTFGAGAEHQRFQLGQSVDFKGSSGGTGRVTFNFVAADDDCGTDYIEKNVTVDLPGKNGSSITYSVLDAAGATVASGTVTDTSLFPLTVTGSRFLFENSGLQRGAFFGYYLRVTVNADA